MTTTFARYGKAKRAQQLGLTAVTFLMLSIWIGPDRACFFILIAAALTVWFWLIRRFPHLGIAAMGFISGLIGTRGYYRPRLDAIQRRRR
jgi:hypothetical protein